MIKLLSGSKEVFAGEALPNTSSVPNPTPASNLTQMMPFFMQQMNAMIQSQNVMLQQREDDRKAVEKKREEDRKEAEKIRQEERNDQRK